MEILRLIQHNKLSFFTTNDILTLSGQTPPAATQALRRLAANKLITKVKHGIWENNLMENINPFEAIPYFTAPWPSYVSLYSALSDGMVIEEVPHIIYGITAGRAKRIQSPIGTFHIHHLPEHQIWGYEIKRTGTRNYPMADPEKAFLDLLYLSLIPRSSLRIPHNRGPRWALNLAKLKNYALRFQFKPLVLKLKDMRLWG